jgi:uncharacterized repeat protein (TIGR01451 family)
MTIGLNLRKGDLPMKAAPRIGILLLGLGAAIWLPAQAQQTRQPQALVLAARNLMAGDSAHRALAGRGKDSATVLPGDLVHYDLRFTNLLRDSVRTVTFEDPLPGGMRYVDRSASADRQDVLVEFSIDSGRTFSATPMIEREVNGRKVQEAAPPERYTHVRWRINGWVRPGAQVTAQFRARFEPSH